MVDAMIISILFFTLLFLILYSYCQFLKHQIGNANARNKEWDLDSDD